ncbi:uncharacterized protein si:ch211-1a19.3 [Cololabis saira]|uniref:uncharacterized protein si:ch211-1a19.3 n=1 Tax=Cololabis saira TaxID=129043 RepID=UPI002AD2A490|nr:uncharacterized protein si:ch211-1a19.3 [Cololabis saira]
MSSAPPKSSGTCKNVALALLALWSIIALVLIVVWATSPDMKGAAQCRAELKEASRQREVDQVKFNKDKVALEELVQGARDERDQVKEEMLRLLGRLNATNVSLEECGQENAGLRVNISVLLEDVEQHRQTEANLTARLGLQEEHMEVLQQNLTQAGHHMASCASLRAAAESHQKAAQSQTKACESREQHLQKQLQKCQSTQSEAAESVCGVCVAPTDAAPTAAVPALMLLVCGALHLIT